MDERTRVTSRVVIEDRGYTSPCWISTRAVHSAGYTVLNVAGKIVYTHRYAYEAFVRKLLPGETIDHLCRVRSCCNPEHLDPVSIAENTRRAFAVKYQNWVPCPAKHSEASMRPTPGKLGRVCRECEGERRRRYRARRKAGLTTTTGPSPSELVPRARVRRRTKG